MKNYLLITLGHNSSAIFVDNSTDEQKIIGYEQERLSRIKADSQFPIDAINEIEHHIGFNKMKGCVILISHWFNTRSMPFGNKYLTEKNFEKLQSYSPSRLEMVGTDFTHHDAHAFSAHAFFKYHDKPVESKAPHHTLVVDGFGNDEEVISLYCTLSEYERPKLIHRVYGYEHSLGLFYQYATAFTGMKENQDEYKFLGYEAHVGEALTGEQIDTLDHYVSDTVERLLHSWMKETTKKGIDKEHLINYEKLSEVRTFWYQVFAEVCNAIGIHDYHSIDALCAIAYFIQQTCEIALSLFIEEFGVQNLSVAGGTFYNVKLNNKLMSTIKGFFCAMPLAGDQGAAIGMYEAENEDDAPAFSFDTLAWGKRRLYNFSKYADGKSVHYHELSAGCESELEQITKEIATHISNGHLVDVVLGNMEFGPRALGNTSTLFLPTEENAHHNNKMNARNEVMPCAPMCTPLAANMLFDSHELNRVVGSDRFMICTHNYKKPYSKMYAGVMHNKPLDAGIYTGRPQIVRPDTIMHDILTRVREISDAKCVVNTSFNAHGNPIAFDTKDILDNFNFQCAHADFDKKPMLYVIKFV